MEPMYNDAGSMRMLAKGVLASTILSLFSGAGSVFSCIFLIIVCSSLLAASADSKTYAAAVQRFRQRGRGCRCNCSNSLDTAFAMSIAAIFFAILEFIGFFSSGTIFMSGLTSMFRTTFYVSRAGYVTCTSSISELVVWLVYAAGSTAIGALHSIVWCSVVVSILNQKKAAEVVVDMVVDARVQSLQGLRYPYEANPQPQFAAPSYPQPPSKYTTAALPSVSGASSESMHMGGPHAHAAAQGGYGPQSYGYGHPAYAPGYGPAYGSMLSGGPPPPGMSFGGPSHAGPAPGVGMAAPPVQQAAAPPVQPPAVNNPVVVIGALSNAPAK